jgi:glucosamine--fructose-6-phosphate aminotransferase (isomerizing)
MHLNNLQDNLQANVADPHPHWMLREIDQQPSVIQACLAAYLATTDRATADRAAADGGDTLLELRLPIPGDWFEPTQEIHILACGTSRHAGLVGQFWLEQLANIPVRVRSGSEFLAAPFPRTAHTWTIAVTQSGETADTLRALELDKKLNKENSVGRSRQLGITNQPQSSLARQVDAVLPTLAGAEVGVAATKTFTAQLFVFYLLALDFAHRAGRLTAEQLQQRLQELHQVPAQMQAVLELNPTIQAIAQSFATVDHCILLGQGVNRAIALEGALKLKETTYLHAEGYAAGEFMHGPMALLDQRVPVIAIAPALASHPTVLENLRNIKALGAPVLGILTEPSAPADLRDLFDHALILPKVSEVLSPFLTVIPLQLLAYYIAVQRGLPVDRPRNITKTLS